MVDPRAQEEYLKHQFLRSGSRYHDIINQIDAKSLATNSLQQDTLINNKQYPKNMKITRIFRKLFDDISFPIIDRLYGNTLSNDFTRGSICFSIDPVDFLTMSENSSRWTSCHSLIGEFKGGLLSLMTDKTTAICYFEDADEPIFMYDEEIAITNKKWRTLIHIHQEDDFIIFNNPYPAPHDYLVKAAALQLMTLFDKPMECDTKSTELTNVLDFIEDYDSKAYNFGDPLHYNDLILMKLDGNYELDEVTIVYDPDQDLKESLIIGNPAICPVCGVQMVTHHKSLECDNCDPMEYCCTCGIAFFSEDLHFQDHELYCEDCYDEEFAFCDICDELMRRSWLQKHVCDSRALNEIIEKEVTYGCDDIYIIGG